VQGIAQPRHPKRNCFQSETFHGRMKEPKRGKKIKNIRKMEILKKLFGPSDIITINAWMDKRSNYVA
jgi:hypothetical protein